VDFNEPADLDDFDNGSLTIESSSGVGNSGYMRSTYNTAGNDGNFTGELFDLSAVGTVIDYSIYVLADVGVQNITTTAGDRAMVTGFRDTAGGSEELYVLMGSTGYDANAATSDWQLEIQGTGSGVAASPVFTVEDGHWYKMDMKFTFASATEWDVNVAVTDYGTDGVSEAVAPEIIYTPTITFADAAIGTAAEVRLQTGENDRTGMNGYDNFMVIPEPATMSLLAIGGLGALLRRRR
jgi:Flp pilus assembly protein TadG